MRRAVLILLVLGVASMLIAGCAQQNVSKPAKTPTPTETSPVKEYATLKELAEKIRKGEIDVGKDYSMKLSGRFHTIHYKILGLDCKTCHVDKSYAKDFLYQRKYKVPVRGAPGVVDRNVCLGCHKQGGIATPWYGVASQ